jgi:uncharacterized protein YjdB
MGYSSDRPDVIKVDNNGVITAVGSGQATITVSVGGKTAQTAFAVR